MKEINRNDFTPTPQFKFPRGADMSARNWELVKRIAGFPNVLGILCHGSFSANPHHETDEGSDLDLTVIVDGPIGASRPYMPGFNFKSYQAMPDGRPLEVDVYLFNINTRPWDVATREGYAASATLVFDRDGHCKKWLEEKTELTPEFRNEQISTLLGKAKSLLEETRTISNPLDQRLSLSKTVKRLVEAVYYFNWTYPADYKWRVSGTVGFEWKPVSSFLDLLKECNSTRNLEESLKVTDTFFNLVKCQAEKEGISPSSCTTCPATAAKAPLRKDVAVARLFTRVDKYSAHSIKKCAKRLLPWNAHDLVWEGVDNCIDLIYLLNEVEIPKVGKAEGLKALEWRPRELAKLLYQAATVQDYGNGDDAISRAVALREIFESIKEKVREENLFSVSSLYDEDFMNEDLFGEHSPYMLVYKYGGYINRQQEEDTYAEKLLKRMSTLTQREKNYLWGLCSQYFVGNDEEFMGLVNEELAPEYLPIWEKVVKEMEV